MISWLLFLMLSASAPAASFTEVPVNTYQVHVRPQLVGIGQDVEQIFLSMPGYPNEVFTAQRLVDQAIEATASAQALCPTRLTTACLTPVESVLRAMRELERVWLSQEARAVFPADATIATLAGKRRWTQMMKSVQGLRVKLEIEVIALSAARKGKRMGVWELRKAVDEIEDWQDLMVIDYVPGRLQDDFRSAWMNFFRPLKKQCVLGNGRVFLAQNLTSLNFYWNLLNVKLTKRIKKTPEGMVGPLNAIQNRWNQVMRVSFGQ